MTLDMEVIDDVLVFEVEGGGLKAVVDVRTGEVIHLEQANVTIHQLSTFVAKVKAGYNKFLTSKDIQDFKI